MIAFKFCMSKGVIRRFSFVNRANRYFYITGLFPKFRCYITKLFRLKDGVSVILFIKTALNAVIAEGGENLWFVQSADLQFAFRAK